MLMLATYLTGAYSFYNNLTTTRLKYIRVTHILSFPKSGASANWHRFFISLQVKYLQCWIDRLPENNKKGCVAMSLN